GCRCETTSLRRRCRQLQRTTSAQTASRSKNALPGPTSRPTPCLRSGRAPNEPLHHHRALCWRLSPLDGHRYQPPRSVHERLGPLRRSGREHWGAAMLSDLVICIVILLAIAEVGDWVTRRRGGWSDE